MSASIKMEDTRGKNLEEMLLNYQQLAMNSLAGPASLWRNGAKVAAAAHSHRFATLAGNQISKSLLPPPSTKVATNLPFSYKPPLPAFPVIPPFLLQSDGEAGEVIYCDLENHRIPGFLIGGEERLCVPPILHSVLKDIELEIINAAFDALLIHCSKCTYYQLQLLKNEKMLPSEVSTAGLIRKTDAERLCTTLLYFKPTKITDPDLRNYPQVSPTCIPVYHECFGEGHGFFYTELYTHDLAQCISCADCEKLFTPERFITHTHFNQENKICHWGFNRRNWRSYLLLSDDEIGDEDLPEIDEAFQRALDKFKNSARKRKPAESSDIWQQMACGSNSVVTSNHSPNLKRRCNRPPKRAYQYVAKSPTIENPESVVSNSDKHLYGKNFVPNISLKASPPDSSPESSADGLEALDLRSPTQRQMSVCSEVKDVEAEEILDVESSDEPEATASGDTTTTDAGNQTETDSTVNTCVAEMEAMFLDVLSSSTLSEDDKAAKKEQYNKHTEQLRQRL